MPNPAVAHWVHNLDPFALRISGEFGIRWYGLSYLLGIAGGWWLLQRWARAGRLPMPAQQVGDFIVTIAIGIVVGGRLGLHLRTGPVHRIHLCAAVVAAAGGA
jgi:phosphatidylglycerol:prolipoprotein diacylglycerol transferase